MTHKPLSTILCLGLTLSVVNVNAAGRSDSSQCVNANTSFVVLDGVNKEVAIATTEFNEATFTDQKDLTETLSSEGSVAINASTDNTAVILSEPMLNALYRLKLTRCFGKC